MFSDLPSHGTTQSILLVYPTFAIPIYSLGHETYYHGMVFGNCRSRTKDISNIAIPKGSQITFQYNLVYNYLFSMLIFHFFIFLQSYQTHEVCKCSLLYVDQCSAKVSGPVGTISLVITCPGGPPQFLLIKTHVIFHQLM